MKKVAFIALTAAVSASLALAATGSLPTQSTAAAPIGTPDSAGPRTASLAKAEVKSPAAGAYAAASLSVDREAARTACKNGDFRAFFDRYVSSAALRSDYNADKLSVTAVEGTGGNWTEDQATVPGSDYADFPIAEIDGSFFYAPTALRGDGGDSKQDPLSVVISTIPDGGRSVEWEQVRYDPKHIAADHEYPEIVARYGDSGVLYFERRSDCWVLTSSKIFKHPAGDRR